MDWGLHEVILTTAYVIVFAIGIVLIHKRYSISYITIILDMLCYCGGGTLTALSVVVICLAHNNLLDWNSVLLVFWYLMALTGVLIFVSRGYYRIRHH